MALKAVLDTLDGLDAALHAHYTKGADGKFRLDAEGVEDVSGLKSALQKEREGRSTAEKALKAFDGLDAAEIRSLVEKFANDEEGKLIKEGKIDLVIQKRTEKVIADAKKQIEAAQQAAAAAEEKAKKWSTRVLDDNLRAAATKVGIHSHAIEDALLRGRQLFTLDDDGNAVQMKDGTVVLSKDGKNPFAPTEWLETMRESASHWFPAQSGGGSQGNRSGAGGGAKKTVTRAIFDTWTPDRKRDFTVKEGGVVTDPA